MKKPEIKDAGAEYAEIWGEAIHSKPPPSGDLRRVGNRVALAHRRRHSQLSPLNRPGPSL